jgi:stage III sporulation protein AD
MDTLFRIAAVAMTAVLFGCVLRRNTPEIALLMLLAAGLWILASVFGALEEVVDMLSRLARLARLEGPVVEPVLKTVALSILTRVTCEVCRAAGEGGIAAFVEVAGTVLALTAVLPLCDGVVQMIAGLLE